VLRRDGARLRRDRRHAARRNPLTEVEGQSPVTADGLARRKPAARGTQPVAALHVLMEPPAARHARAQTLPPSTSPKRASSVSPPVVRSSHAARLRPPAARRRVRSHRRASVRIGRALDVGEPARGRLMRDRDGCLPAAPRVDLAPTPADGANDESVRIADIARAPRRRRVTATACGHPPEPSPGQRRARSRRQRRTVSGCCPAERRAAARRWLGRSATFHAAGLGCGCGVDIAAAPGIA